jgi:acetyl esterase/lipase
MDTVLLVVGAVCVLHAVNALAPRKGRLLLIPSFFASWLTIELAPWWLVWQVVVGAALVLGDGLSSGRGWAGLALLVVSIVVHALIIQRARHTTLQVSEAIKDLELDPDDRAPTFPRSKVVFPFLMRRWPETTVVRNITFAEATTRNGKPVRLRLDVTKPCEAQPGDKRPGILQIHGGGWVIGDKREQGLPAIGHLCTNGWVAINANYRLSPRVGFPEHLIDCKRAIAWWREHAEEHGGDPDFLCVTGQSAGGHLTALVALTANDPRYQPGFEDVDTTMRAAVPIYGVYDFTNRLGTWHKDSIKRFIEPVVMQRRLADDPQAFADYSPLDRVREDAPPFLVIHGSIDTLAPVEDAREFVKRLRAVSRNPVLYAEMAGAQHAFEIFPSYRTARVIEGIERFLHSVRTGRPVAEELVD